MRKTKPVRTFAGSTSQRFIYRGNAVAIGGRIHQIGNENVSKPIQSPTASSLAVVGGFSRSAAEGSNFDDVFFWGNNFAESTGEVRTDGTPVTTVISSIEQVRAVNRPIEFQADLIRVTVVSEHPTQGQPSIYLKEAIFGGDKGMFFNKLPVRVDTDLKDFQNLTTLSDFENEFRTNRRFFNKYRDRFRRTRGLPPIFGSRIPRITGGYVSGSIVSSITWGDEKIPGHALTLEGFGSIYFGEVLINEYNRRLTMVRFQMGSEVRADAACAEVDPNGSWD